MIDQTGDLNLKIWITYNHHCGSIYPVIMNKHTHTQTQIHTPVCNLPYESWITFIPKTVGKRKFILQGQEKLSVKTVNVVILTNISQQITFVKLNHII